MEELQEVIKQRDRMCELYKYNCFDCEIKDLRGAYDCCSYIFSHPQQVEEIIMKWEEEHPVQTNTDKFKEVFRRTPMACVFEDYDCNCKKCNECYLADFWQQEYKEPKGE